MVSILKKSAKLTTPGLLEIKVFWNKVFDVTIQSMMSPTKLKQVTQFIL